MEDRMINIQNFKVGDKFYDAKGIAGIVEKVVFLVKELS
jgi:hypothetical protein